MKTKCRLNKLYKLEWRIDNFFDYLSRNANQEIVSQIQEENKNGPLLYQAKISFSRGTIQVHFLSQQDEILPSLRCYLLRNDNQETLLFHERNINMKKLLWCPIMKPISIQRTSESYVLLRFYIDTQNTSLNVGEHMVKDLTPLLMNSAFSDVTVKTSEGEEIPAHKVLLVSRSAVFRALFDHDTVEKSTNLVESPFPTHIVNDLLCYIYTDTANNIDKTAPGLLVAADYYHLDGLKVLCEDELVKSLNIENAVDRLKLADTYHADRLKKKAMEFINGCAADIIKTDAWKSMESADLAKTIYEFSLLNK